MAVGLGLCVVTVLMAASVLLAVISIAWYRLSPRSPAFGLRHLMSSAGITAADEEEQGLLTDVVAGSAAAADTTATDDRPSPASRPNRLGSSAPNSTCQSTVCLIVMTVSSTPNRSNAAVPLYNGVHAVHY